MKLPGMVTRTMGASKLSLKSNTPAILTGAGVLGFVATSVLLIRATNKSQPAVTTFHKDLYMAKMKAEDEEYTDRETTRAVTRVYAENSLAFLKLFGPSLAVGSASIVCIVAAHGMMAKRQVSLVAAYTGLDAAYRAYRSRIREEFGEEKEKELFYDVKQMRIFDDESDQEGHVVIDHDDRMPSPYARFFDPHNPNWTKTPEYNLMFLRAQQQWACDKLRADGFLFLNDVYVALGLERSQAGQMVGWKFNGDGDGYVDFGLYLIGDECSRSFVNVIEPTVLLDFNVDGVIQI